MNTRMISLFATLLTLTFNVAARQISEQIDLPSCQLMTRTINAGADGPRFIMMEGVPLSGAVFEKLGNQLTDHLNASSTLIDFPGVGGSSLKGQNYNWGPLRNCLREFLAKQPAHVFVLGDLAMPVIAPLLQETPQIRGLVSFNSVIKASELHPPFPMNFLRCCPRLAVAVSSVTPAAFFKHRIRTIGLSRPDSVSEAEMNSLYVEMRQNRGMNRLARLMRDIALDEETDQLIAKGLATPLPQLFLWGEADPALGLEYRKLPQLTNNQRLIVFPQARHFLMMDHAVETAKAILEWHEVLPEMPHAP